MTPSFGFGAPIGGDVLYTRNRASLEAVPVMTRLVSTLAFAGLALGLACGIDDLLIGAPWPKRRPALRVEWTEGKDRT